jgi:hypothetical protein
VRPPVAGGASGNAVAPTARAAPPHSASSAVEAMTWRRAIRCCGGEAGSELRGDLDMVQRVLTGMASVL